MRRYIPSKFAGVLAVATMLMASSASGALVFDLGTIICSSGTPGGTPPWLRATITQDEVNSVQIKMDAVNLVATSLNIEAVKEWAFNLNPTIRTSELTASEVTRSGDGFNPNPIKVLSKANGYGGFSFNFDFEFATAQGADATKRFTQGDSVTIILTRTSGLSESDFNYSALQNGRDFYSGAQIISINGGGSAFVGALAVPEPSTIIAGALLLLPFGASTIRILRRNRKA
jgi:hypothetical protein